MIDRVITDTTNFFSIERGDIIAIEERYYRVTGHERERRFGVEDPKFWVKRVVDSETGEKKIIKLSYFENFNISIGGMQIDCFRNPEKEAKILDLVKSHPHFMQGKAYKDSKGNIMRLLEPVLGNNFLIYIDTLKMEHEIYFYTILPDILKEIVKAFEGVRILHEQGYKHGDIRNDHIIVEQGTGNYVWIDFDYDFITEENPFSMDLLGLGNILLYAIGKGFHNRKMIRNNTEIYGDLISRVEDRDFSIVNKRRFMNLRKLYPYVPTRLNNILAHFAIGAEIFYESVDEILDDLMESIDSDLQ